MPFIKGSKYVVEDFDYLVYHILIVFKYSESQIKYQKMLQKSKSSHKYVDILKKVGSCA